MRAGEIANLAGTTVRTIRYYHEIGLLPVPEVRHGCRDYELIHVARLIRIRWLVESGLPLQKVAQTLVGRPLEAVSHRPTRLRPDGGPVSGESHETTRSIALADLHEALASSEERLREVSRQHERLAQLVASIESGGTLTPMPPVLAHFYDDLEERAPDEATSRAVQQERNFVELACFRGEMPPEAGLLYADTTEESMREGLAAFRAGVTAGDLSDAEVEQLAAANVARMKARLGENTAAVVGSLDAAAVQRLYDLYDATADERGRRIGRAMRRQLLKEIKEVHSS